MLEVIRRHGLLAFLLAFALVTLAIAAADIAAGRLSGWAGAAMLLIAVAAEEMHRRAPESAFRYLDVVRWSGVLGALGFLLWRA